MQDADGENRTEEPDPSNGSYPSFLPQMRSFLRTHQVKTALRSPPELTKTFSFTMKDGTTFKGYGINCYEAFTRNKPKDQWDNIVEWDYLPEEAAPEPAEAVHAVHAETSEVEEETFELVDDTK